MQPNQQSNPNFNFDPNQPPIAPANGGANDPWANPAQVTPQPSQQGYQQLSQ
jgi:hypothetical protein